jgi:hypothetical protein
MLLQGTQRTAMAGRLWPRIAAFTLVLACATGVLVAAGLAEDAAPQAGTPQRARPSNP